jgi:ABC-type oligopeptide transport system substrate-binding subunit
VPQLQADKNIKLVESPPGTFYTFTMRVDAKPFTDNRIREALNWSSTGRRWSTRSCLGTPRRQ